jgi:hypothetical protein
MDQQNPTVSDLFRGAQAARVAHPDWSYKQIKDFIVKEFSNSNFPPFNTLTIPEQDDKAPEEDWTAGLPIIRRGIQFQDWKEIADGIILSLEQTENYQRERGPEGDRDEWHNRNVGINEATTKAVGKWMPAELLELAERNVKK